MFKKQNDVIDDLEIKISNIRKENKRVVTSNERLLIKN